MLLDVVAVLEDVPQHGLLCVEVGTVVELWKDGVFEVEFSDTSGRVYAFAALRADQLLKVNFSTINRREKATGEQPEE